MKITALMGHGYSLQEINEAVDLNALEIAAHISFHDKDSRDHKNEAIDKVLELEIPFRTTRDTLYLFVKRYISVTCPKCGSVMKVLSGSGSGKEQSINFRCANSNDCTSILRLKFPSDDGIEYLPAYGDRR